MLPHERALRCMARCLKKISETCFGHSNLQHSMDDVSNGTLELLKQGCNTTVVQKPPKRRCRHHRNGCQTSDTVCYTKKIVSDLQICWIEFIQ
ncbi:hypothetical protein JD844_016056 [Phrynosoma platyrhinos]|uniref:Uncharacterized protein n=1 Tax=Phrynosoma platyrhinos TaxID=52577 RepID=A0ABQ7SJZ7_PHRPL|nr:hypothetical protein JD844_016056 [Phrynosoma platyrhinos]